MTGIAAPDSRELAGDEKAELALPDLRVLSGNPTAAELAAVAVVVGALAQELQDGETLAAASGPDAWARSTRALRQPLSPGRGAWRGFTG